MKTDYLVTGAQGQLGRVIMALAKARGRSAVGVDVQEMPLDQRAAIQSVVAANKPRFVIHCGAITNVDGCEADPLVAFRINGLATAWVAEAAAQNGAAMVYVSTDFVFDGTQNGVPYAVDAAPKPISVYGACKRLGEEAVLAHGRPDFYVVRTSWVFGPGGKNFPRAILDRAKSGQPLKVVTDQIGRPTMTHDLAEALLDVCESKAPGGIYHAANEGQCSWHQFAVDILRESGLGPIAVGTQTAAEYAAMMVASGKKPPAPRPAWSVLDTDKLAKVRGKRLPHYTDALQRHLALDVPPAADDGKGAPLRGKQY